MAKKTWIIWAICLLLPGLVGLSIQQVKVGSMRDRIKQAAKQIAGDPVKQEYLGMYEQWSDLPAAQKANNPWGYGFYGGAAIQKRLQEGQADRLLSEIKELEKGYTHYPDELTDVMYGPGWQQEVEDYKSDRATMETVLSGALLLLTGSGLILCGVGGKLLYAYILEKKRQKALEAEAENADDAEETTEEGIPVASQVSDESEEDLDASEEENDSEGAVEVKAESTSDPDSAPTEASASHEREAQSQPEDNEADSEKDKDKDKDKGGYFLQFKSKHGGPTLGNHKATELPMQPVKPLDSSKEDKKGSFFSWPVEEDEGAELETLMTNEPLTKELTELTEEVSAIRHFAAQQQDQMRKLQDGYDWIIIRRFCLRIIRCVDNIDDRVTRLVEKNDNASVYLEDIRDELIFAMEASGVEQFGPDQNSSFKGLEKQAEAVRERVYTEDEGLIGCVAEVTRPGYQYLVNDDDVKIVRCAQVKLYEAKV